MSDFYDYLKHIICDIKCTSHKCSHCRYHANFKDLPEIQELYQVNQRRLFNEY